MPILRSCYCSQAAVRVLRMLPSRTGLRQPTGLETLDLHHHPKALYMLTVHAQRPPHPPRPIPPFSLSPPLTTTLTLIAVWWCL